MKLELKYNYSFVLEDDLFREYHKYMNPEECVGKGDIYNRRVIKELLSYHIKPFLYNKAQAERLNINMPRELEIQLQHKGVNGLSLEELAAHTFYQGILSTRKESFPYVNIHSSSEKIRAVIAGSYYAHESRQKAISHIKSLCKDAKEIVVFDKYLSATTSANALDTLSRILPQNKEVRIVIHNRDEYGGNGSIIYDHKDVGKQLCGFYAWTIEEKELRVNSHHDRYLVIDGKKEIVVSSGFSYLGDDLKDVTYLVCPYTGHLYD